jgi:hypothetical protein
VQHHFCGILVPNLNWPVIFATVQDLEKLKKKIEEFFSDWRFE